MLKGYVTGDRSLLVDIGHTYIYIYIRLLKLCRYSARPTLVSLIINEGRNTTIGGSSVSNLFATNAVLLTVRIGIGCVVKEHYTSSSLNNIDFRCKGIRRSLCIASYIRIWCALMKH